MVKQIQYVVVRINLSEIPLPSLFAKASTFQTLTGESSVKNRIQRTTFYVQRSSGARVMVGFVFAKFLFFTYYFRKSSEHVDRCLDQAMSDSLYF